MTTRIPTHPGAILREDVLPELNLSVTEIAKHLGVARVTLSRVLHEHTALSPSLALRLESAGIGTARAWLAMQTNHDLAVERESLTLAIGPLVPAIA
jgi:addiction module HigA family antidote